MICAPFNFLPSLAAVLLLAAGSPPLQAQDSTPRDQIYYFPHLAVGASWQTTITYINYSPQEVTCQTDFISDHGTPLMVSFAGLGTVDSRTDVLPPGGSVHQETNVELSAPLAPGWARATCTGPVQASLLFRGYNSEGMPVAEAGVNAATVPATRFVTFAEQGEGKNGTGVAYANPSDTAALVTFTARDADGEVLATKDLMLPPNGHGAQNMPTLFDLSSFTGSLEVTSTEPIVSLSLNFEAAPGFSSLPPGELDASAQGSTTYYFPHLAVGASWQTTITYINYSREEVTCQTDFISDHGSPLMVSFAELGTVDSRTDVLPPGGSVHQETDVALSAPLAPGWARANCTGPVQASLLFRWYNSEGMPVAEAGVNAATVPATRFVTFAEQGEGKNGTGVAYANPSDTAALVTFTARDADGEVRATKDLMLPPNGHGAQNMPTLFDLSSFTGSLEVTSTVPIVSLSLNFEAAPVFSSLPPGDIPGEMLAPTDEDAFNDLFVGKRATTNYPTVYVDFVSPGRFRETEGSDIWTGSYTYRNTGPNTGTVTFNYDNGDRCVASFTFVSTTAGTATYTCNDGSSGGYNWLLVAISASGTPDLVVQTPSVSDSNPNAGESFTLSAAVRNQGNGLSASTTLRYYRSPDATISTSDTAVGTDAVGGLAASGTSAESISLTALSAAGTYYYGACVDPVSGESDTRNNCSRAVTVTVASPIPVISERERAALEALYDAAGGPNWTNNDNWLSDAPLRDWHGVQVDSEGRVASLSLLANALAGSIPPELGNLSRLRTLQLSGTADPNYRSRQVGDGLTGPIPPELGNLSELRVLELPGNNLTGSIPSELGDLSNLQLLHLGSNNLKGPIPSELGDLSNLQWLDLELNELSGGIPPELAALTNLRELDLGSNELSGGIPPELADLTNLQWLNLGGNELSGGIPPELADLTNLQGLYLGGNELSGRIPPELGRLTNLEGLSLWGNELSGSIPPELGDLTNLEGLSLWGNELSGGIPPELADLTNLQWLELGGNRLNGKIPWELMQLSELRKFDISRTDICVPTDDDFQAWLATISDFRSSRLACDGSLRVAFSPSSYVVREGGSVEVTVRLIDQTEGPARSATIALTVTPGGGAAGHDYAGVPERVTITAPASTGTFLVTAVEDHHYDHAETITFGFRRPLPSGVTVGSPDTATVTIIDPGTVAMTDREVLEALYEVTGGPEWRDRTNWLSEAPLGEWFGVVTDRNGWVTSLALPGNGLRGAIPPALGRLASLQRMDLGDRWDPEARQWVDNELSGGIPPELADLTNLQELDLGGNELSGEIPPELGRLASLERLDLGARWDPSARRYFRGNELSGAIPRELGDLTNLQVLNLGHNELNGAIPPELGDLTNLQWLDLRRNELSGAIPPELGDLTNLQVLSLWDNELSGEIPRELGDLTNLQWLNLWINDLSGEIPPELGDLTNLQVLELGGNDLSGAIPRELAGLSNLEVLFLWGNELSGGIPPELAALTNLQVLRLGVNDLSGGIPPELAALTNLQVLNLGHNELNGAIPPELADLTNLQGLDLGGNELSGRIPPELGRLTNLEGLSLWGNELSGSIPPELGDLTNLIGLRIGFNPNLTGPIPRQLLQLRLSILDLMATAVCVPLDEEFQDWLATISLFTPSGAICGRLPEAMTSIDVAVFYTPAARRRAGGTAEIEAEIDLLVAETNQAYEDSGVNQRIVLAAREEVPYEEENGSGDLAIDRLASERDGYMDEVHAIRDRVGADLVHLITEVTDVGGVAHLTGAFGLTCAACDAGVFAHELGHNMGLSHDRYVDHGLLPYSYGYVNQRAFADGAPESARWRTIMAYGNQCADTGLGCVKILRFSNPNQSYLGDPLGVSGESRTSAVTGPADAARALNITRHSVAAFRARSQDTISRAPSGGKQAARSPPVPGVRSGGLFTAISPPKHGVAESDPKALLRREVAVDIGILAQVPADRPTALPLNLFDDVMLTGVIVKRTPTFSGGYALTGPLFGVAGGTVALVVNRDVVAGTVRLPGATYRIRPAGAGRHAIVQVDPSQSSWHCGTELWPR